MTLVRLWSCSSGVWSRLASWRPLCLLGQQQGLGQQPRVVRLQHLQLQLLIQARRVCLPALLGGPVCPVLRWGLVVLAVVLAARGVLEGLQWGRAVLERLCCLRMK